MTGMIERVSVAIEDQMASDDNAPEQLAIAAIKAMRECTEAIKPTFDKYYKIKYNDNSPYRAEHTWKAMLNVALGEHA